MPLAPVPGVEPVGEPVIAKTRDAMQPRQAHEAAEPDIARRPLPYFDRAIRAHMQAAVGIDAMQPAAHVLDPDREAGKSIRLEIDVAKLDCARARRPHQPVSLPLDARVADRAFGVVPDRELREYHRGPRSI